MLVSVSTMPAGNNYLKYVKEIENFTDFMHLDVCDGVYNQTKCFSVEFAKEINRNSTIPLDCHLMTKNAINFAEDYIKAGANIVTAQIESFETKNEVLKYINFVHDRNALCGLSLEIETKLDEILQYLKYLDIILIMSVKTGKSGQKFDESVILKIKKLAELRQKNKLDFKIEVDGGITEKEAIILKNFGVDIVVSGNFVFSSQNKKDAINLLK